MRHPFREKACWTRTEHEARWRAFFGRIGTNVRNWHRTDSPVQQQLRLIMAGHLFLN